MAALPWYLNKYYELKHIPSDIDKIGCDGAYLHIIKKPGLIASFIIMIMGLING